MPRHADQIRLSEAAGAVLQEMSELGVLTNTNVNASATVAALKTAITTAVSALSVHAEIKPMLDGFLKAIDTLSQIGDLTDTNVNASTTVAALLALTAASNTSFRKSSLIA